MLHISPVVFRLAQHICVQISLFIPCLFLNTICSAMLRMSSSSHGTPSPFKCKVDDQVVWSSAMLESSNFINLLSVWAYSICSLFQPLVCCWTYHYKIWLLYASIILSIKSCMRSQIFYFQLIFSWAFE